MMCAGVSLLVLIVCDSALTAGGRKRKQNRVGLCLPLDVKKMTQELRVKYKKHDMNQI